MARRRRKLGFGRGSCREWLRPDAIPSGHECHIKRGVPRPQVLTDGSSSPPRHLLANRPEVRRLHILFDYSPLRSFRQISASVKLLTSSLQLFARFVCSGFGACHIHQPLLEKTNQPGHRKQQVKGIRRLRNPKHTLSTARALSDSSKRRRRDPSSSSSWVSSATLRSRSSDVARFSLRRRPCLFSSSCTRASFLRASSAFSESSFLRFSPMAKAFWRASSLALASASGLCSRIHSEAAPKRELN